MVQARQSKHQPEATMLLPPRGFVHDYLTTYIHDADPGLTHAPDTFHLLTALSVLSTAIADKATVQLGGRPFRPLIYGLLVGDSGAGKTTAINYGMDVLRAIPEFHDRVAPSDTSAEGLIHFLTERNKAPTAGAKREGRKHAQDDDKRTTPAQAKPPRRKGKPGEVRSVLPVDEDLDTPSSPKENKEPLPSLRPPVVLVWEEFGDFIAITAPNSWGARLRTTLMALHDQPEVHLIQRANKAVVTLKHPLVGILAGVNMALLNEQKEAEVDWTGGFMPRFVTVACGGFDNNEVTLENVNPRVRYPAPQDRAVVLRLANKLQDIRKGAHPLSGMTDGARRAVDAWWDEHDRRDRTYLTESVWHRLPTHVYRIAALYTLDLDPTSGQITEEAVVHACALADVVWKTTGLMTRTTPKTAVTKLQERMFERIRAAGDIGIRERALLQMSHLLKRDFKEHIDTLEMGYPVKTVVRKVQGQPVRYVVYAPERENEEGRRVVLTREPE